MQSEKIMLIAGSQVINRWWIPLSNELKTQTIFQVQESHKRVTIVFDNKQNNRIIASEMHCVTLSVQQTRFGH